MGGFDARKATNAARLARIDPLYLPKERLKVQWTKIPGGGGTLGVVEGGWFFAQIRVMRGPRGQKLWKTLFTLDDGQDSRGKGTCETFPQGEVRGLQWVNDKMLDWAEVRQAVDKARQPCPVVVYDPPPPLSFWQRLVRWIRLLWGPVLPS